MTMHNYGWLKVALSDFDGLRPADQRVLREAHGLSHNREGLILHIEGEIGIEGKLRPDISETLVESGVSFNCRINSEVPDESDAFGYWRPGMGWPMFVDAAEAASIEIEELEAILEGANSDSDALERLRDEIERRSRLIPPLEATEA